MKWFLVKYIYQIISGNGNHHPQFDEQIRLLIARNSLEALYKAEDLAKSFHQPFKNCQGETVAWKFICIADLHEIETPVDGIEVTSTVHEPEDPSAFLNEVNQRKKFLRKDVLATKSLN